MLKRLSTLSMLGALCTAGLTFASAAIPRASQTTDTKWKRLDAGAFSLYAPPGWEFHQKQGIDSYVGEFSGESILLHFDYGLYSNPLEEEKPPKYTVTHEQIGGKKAKIVSPQTDGKGLTAIYFPRVKERDKLCVWANDLTETQQALVLKILRTIQFP